MLRKPRRRFVKRRCTCSTRSISFIKSFKCGDQIVVPKSDSSHHPQPTVLQRCVHLSSVNIPAAHRFCTWIAYRPSRYTSVTYKSYSRNTWRLLTSRNDNSEYCGYCFKLTTAKQPTNTNDWTTLSYYTNTEYALTVHDRYTQHRRGGHIMGGVSTVTYQSIIIKPITCQPACWRLCGDDRFSTNRNIIQVRYILQIFYGKSKSKQVDHIIGLDWIIYLLNRAMVPASYEN